MLATRRLLMLLAVVIAACAAPGGDGGDRVVRTDHQVRVVSTAPSMAGREVQIYLREVASSTMPRAPVVLFVHGAGTPAEVAFDVPYKDYSWMAYLARAGFDVFSMDLTGLRAYDTSTADERHVQPLEGAAGAVHPQVHGGTVQPHGVDRDDHDGVRLGRHRRGRRSPAQAARRGSCVAGGLVAGRPARGRLRGALPPQG